VDASLFAKMRVQLEDPHREDDARQFFLELVNEANPETSIRAADVLVDWALRKEKYGEAYEFAQASLLKYPDSALAFRFSRIPPVQQAEAGFSADLGYRIEFDDNVTFPDEAFASGKEDLRHVLMADLLYERPLAEGWNFYAQGNFFQSFHNDLDQFDQTRIAGSAAIGQSGQKMGWRLPLEFSHDRLDGDPFRTSLAALPGFYVQFGDDFFSHFYTRLQSDDYDIFPSVDEDRSGDVTGAGVLLVGQMSPRLNLRGYLEFNQYDTDGRYWERDEIVAFVLGEFEFTQKWISGFALRYQDEDYDNARPIFSERQQDESKEFYLNLTHKFAEQWRWRGQISFVNHESNIAIFDYDRSVYSISITREF
jgi:hypothetical protein